MAEGIVGAVPVALELAEELSHLSVKDGPPAGQSNRFSAEEEEKEGERKEWEGGGKEEEGGRGRGNIQLSLETLASVQQTYM